MNEKDVTSKYISKISEIDYVVILKKLWSEKRIILNGLGIGTVIGLLVAILTPKEYTASTVMMLQSESSGGGGMSQISSLAAIAGFDLNVDAGSDISPVIYPQIINSESFMLDIMYSKYTFKDVAKPVNMFDYYKHKKPGVLEAVRKFTLGLPGVIVEAIRKQQPMAAKTKNDSIIYITKDQDKMITALREQINVQVNKKDGYVTVTTRFPEAVLAAQVAKRTQDLLQEKITGYKIQKSKNQLAFIRQRYNEKKANFYNIQARLADFKDRNQNMFFASAGTEKDRLENDYNIANSVYSELAKQLEQAEIQVKNDTPVFAILKPVVVPFKKSKPNRISILLVGMFLGTFLGAGFVLGREYYHVLKKDPSLLTA